MDTICMLTDDNFISGGQDGHLYFWKATKKRPFYTKRYAHDKSWITSLTSVPYSNLCISGGQNGSIKLWSTNKIIINEDSSDDDHTSSSSDNDNQVNSKDGLYFLDQIQVNGYINDISISENPNQLVSFFISCFFKEKEQGKSAARLRVL